MNLKENKVHFDNNKYGIIIIIISILTRIFVVSIAWSYGLFILVSQNNFNSILRVIQLKYSSTLISKLLHFFQWIFLASSFCIIKNERNLLMYLLAELIAWFKPDQILNLADYLMLFKLCKTDLIKNNLNGSMYSKNICVMPNLYCLFCILFSSKN